ncbi:hypothetical protein J2T13_000189 [Paenibacillus sp. DS2015]|uniref:hypothetical protein n=1 Tax=Paenibacillus sp. DS2015 TaxID=3373917 RepID=UPI003D1F6095
MIYVIESIRNRDDGSPHEREARRKGQRVELLSYDVGSPMLVCYRDDHNSILRTSEVVSVLGSDCGSFRRITTKNTVYTFREEVVDHPEN